MNKQLMLVGPIITTSEGYGWQWVGSNGCVNTSIKHPHKKTADLAREDQITESLIQAHVVFASTTEIFNAWFLALKELEYLRHQASKQPAQDIKQLNRAGSQNPARQRG